MPFRNLTVAAEPPQMFLENGGDMGARMRAFAWDQHPMGPLREWPTPLRTTLRILLTTQHPMFIFWGSEHHCFYNDAYARSLGPEKHPSMLGAKALDKWEEIWDVIGPQIRDVMAGNGSTWHENHLVPIYRHGRQEAVYWTYSFSPIDDATTATGVGGVLVVCTETTDQVLAKRRLSFLVQLDDDLRPLADARDIVASAINALGRHVSASRVGFGLVQSDDKTILLETNYTDGAQPVAGFFLLHQFGEHNIQRQRRGETVVWKNIAMDLTNDAAPYRAIETMAVISVPLVRDGRFQASLFVHDRRARDWSPYEVSLVEAVATRVWDAVQRARAEVSVRASNQRFQVLADVMPHLVWVTDVEGSTEFVNQEWVQYTGLPADKSVGRDWWLDLIHSEDRERTWSRWSHSSSTGEPYENEFRLRRHDGVYRWFLVRGRPERDASGRIARWLGTCTDIDGSRKSEEKLRATEAALLEFDRNKDAFLATLSHELRNSLAPIRTAAHVLGLSKLDVAKIQWARDIIERQGGIMGLLLDDLLDITRIKQGKLKLEMRPVKVTDIVESAVETVRPILDKKGHKFAASLPSEELFADADPLRLTQVLSNLLINAAKYTGDGGTIQLAVYVRDGDICLSVMDSGIGIESKNLTRIFDPFSQIDEGQSRSETGLGIGLALVKGLIALHGGTVEARSDGTGLGSEFIVRLPSPVEPPSEV